ncbi:CoA synthetase, partial [Rhodopseudomonas palustris]|uniref:CoA transferase n=1 Tax=Rhodopseudomonas palustris TaxID=1076 RepID=UPI0026E53971
MGQIVSIEALAAQIRDGMMMAVPSDTSGVAMAATVAIIANRPRNLHLVCIPISGLQADMLIGEGLVGTVETSAIS